MKILIRPWRLYVILATAFVFVACSGNVSAPVNSSLTQAGFRQVASSEVEAPVNWHLSVGADRNEQALQALDYFPNAITIDAGDSVTWTVKASVHTISFLLPGQSPFTAPLGPAGGSTEDGTVFTSSGILPIGATYKLTFPKPGTYSYNCLLHPPEMEARIIVQRAGAPYPHTQAFYNQEGAVESGQELDAALGSIQLFPYTDGGTTLVAGISPGLAAGIPSESTVYRFLDADNLDATTVTIPVGTTVTWVNQTNNEPHTITFPKAGQPLPPPIKNNPFSPPMGGSTYDGTEITNSGPIGNGFPAQSYKLKFTKRGTFIYYCLFHDDFGMIGNVVVQ